MTVRTAGALAALVFSLVAGLPAIAAAQDRDAECALLSRTGGQYARVPLPGFDPSSPAPLSIEKPEGGAAVVLCRRGTIFPEPTDYRVPAELHLPLAITDERRVLYLEIVDGKLQASLRKGHATPDEEAEVKARVDEMQAAMQAQKPAN